MGKAARYHYKYHYIYQNTQASKLMYNTRDAGFTRSLWTVMLPKYNVHLFDHLFYTS